MNDTQGTHFYFMAAIGPGRGAVEMSGTVTRTPTATKHGIYMEVRENVCAEIGCAPAELTVTAFSLEPNEIGARP